MTPVDAALEHEYVFSDRFPERTAVYEAIAASSEAARRDWPVRVDLAYGAHPRERLDLFARGPGSPLLVFVHGGYVQRCRSLGADASMLVLPTANHYTVLLDLDRDDGQFVRAIHSRATQDAVDTP